MPALTPQQVQEIHDLIHRRHWLQAIQVYRDATGVSLAEAKEAVEEMVHNELTKPPSGVRRYDDPVLEAKIRSLLSRGKKMDAIQIYRDEYDVSLKEARDAVERIASAMPGGPVSGVPYESAIGKDPFADDEATGRRALLVLGVAAAILLSGLCVFALSWLFAS